MREQDKVFARWALKRKRLTIEQVEEIRAESGRTGRSFRDVAVGRGLLSAPDFQPPPPVKIPPVFAGLLAATMIKMGERTKKDDDLALETERSLAEADRKGAEASRGYKRSLVSAHEAAAREHLAKARAAMVRVDKMLASAASAMEISLALNEAFVGYNMYLEEIPDDAPVRVERARTHELRRNYDKAIADLERAIELDRRLEPTLKDRIIQLRLLLPRKPQ